jgi:hypothetical protein
MDEMNRDKSAERPTAHETTSLLHPRVYALMMGLAGWLVLSVWIFSAGGSTDYLLTIVSGFISIAVALPFIPLACGVPIAIRRRFERGNPRTSTHGRDVCAGPTRPPKFCCQ